MCRATLLAGCRAQLCVYIVICVSHVTHTHTHTYTHTHIHTPERNTHICAHKHIQQPSATPGEVSLGGMPLLINTPPKQTQTHTQGPSLFSPLSLHLPLSFSLSLSLSLPSISFHSSCFCVNCNIW